MMLDLDRLTTGYSPEEDRISLTAELRSGGTLRIWLTQRMCGRLIGSLVQVLTPRHVDAAYVEAISTVAQQRAVGQLEPQAPVSAAALTQDWLARKIELQLAASGAVLIFFGPGDEMARLTMTNELLRQWLGMLHKGYVAGEWISHSWPEWIEPTVKPAVVSRVLH